MPRGFARGRDHAPSLMRRCIRPCTSRPTVMLTISSRYSTSADWLGHRQYPFLLTYGGSSLRPMRDCIKRLLMQDRFSGKSRRLTMSIRLLSLFAGASLLALTGTASAGGISLTDKQMGAVSAGAGEFNFQKNLASHTTNDVNFNG